MKLLTIIALLLGATTTLAQAKVRFYSVNVTSSRPCIDLLAVRKEGDYIILIRILMIILTLTTNHATIEEVKEK